MDMQKGFPMSDEKSKEDVIQKLNSCCLCGTALEFVHVTHKHDGQVKEAAKCPACGIQTKVNTFILQ